MRRSEPSTIPAIPKRASVLPESGTLAGAACAVTAAKKSNANDKYLIKRGIVIEGFLRRRKTRGGAGKYNVTDRFTNSHLGGAILRTPSAYSRKIRIIPAFPDSLPIMHQRFRSARTDTNALEPTINRAAATGWR